MSFETFIPRKMVSSKPKVTILHTGIFWVNRFAMEEMFKDLNRTFLLYDRERKVIGFKPTTERGNTYSLSRAKSRNDITISGKSFLEYFKIDYEQTRSYIPVWSEKEKAVIEIDLNKPV